MAAASCPCSGCSRTNCGKCQGCSKSDRCLLRRCQRYAYSLESDEKWQLEVQQLFQDFPHLRRRQAPPPEKPPQIITINELNDNPVIQHHHYTVVPNLVSTIQYDVGKRHPRPRVSCGDCSKCHIGACHICPNCCQQKDKCPFVVCETISYSLRQITKMEKSARRAWSLNPKRLSRLYESLYGKDGFMTRQKAERQTEKETIYPNMYGDTPSTSRQIMLRSRFPRVPSVTPVPSNCDDDGDDCVYIGTYSGKGDMPIITPCQPNARDVRKKPRTDRATYKSSKILEFSLKPILPGLGSHQTKKNVMGRKRNAKGEFTMQSTTKSVKTDKAIFTRDESGSEATEPRHNIPQSRLPPKQLFSDVHRPSSRHIVTPVAPFQPKLHCRRCSIITVCGLCFECNRIKKIHENESMSSSQRADRMDTSRRDRLINYIQSSLKVAIQRMEAKHNAVGQNAPSATKVKVEFDSSSTYMEQLWRDRDHLYLFGNDLLNRPASFVAGIDASPRSGSQRKLDEHFRANDGGGPSRQFLSMFWRYLPKITLMNKTYGKYSIFEETDEFLRPLCDERIYKYMEDYYELEETAVYRCYRALGRIIGFCILHHYHISHNVLSKIHRNYLFRGVSPKESPGTSDLVRALGHSIGHQSKEDDMAFDNLGALLDGEPHKETEVEGELRDYAYEIYIERNMIFLEAVKEGMRLDVMEAESIPEIFNPIRPSLVDDLFFGTAAFDVEDVIAALQPVYAGEHERRNNGRLAIQKQALRKMDIDSKPQGAFVNALRTLSRNDKDFPALFVFYITGYYYLPVAETLTVEFNYKEMPNNESFPAAHTCHNTLKLPGLAYSANEDLIKAKLCKALNEFKHSKSPFNMK